jgi:hypothetical protein
MEKYRQRQLASRLPYWLVGYAGPHSEAQEIKGKIGRFLEEVLKLKLSDEKTLITHARTGAARFLGYEVVVQRRDDKIASNNRRGVNGKIGLRLPARVLQAKCAYYAPNGRPIRRTPLLDDDDYSIVARFQSEFRGLVQYYQLAQNVSQLGKLQWLMGGSLLHTLAAKHKSSVRAMFRKYRSTVSTPFGSRRCLEITVTRGQGKKPLVARFGGIPLRRSENAVLVDKAPRYVCYERNELLKKLLADRCEFCGSTEALLHNPGNGRRQA